MELKDVILSTLAEMEENLPEQTKVTQKVEKKEKIAPKKEENIKISESELMYLNSIRERLLVLFEGFQAPNNIDIEAKVDLTLNFLEYVLATIDSRLDSLEKGNKK